MLFAEAVLRLTAEIPWQVFIASITCHLLVPRFVMRRFLSAWPAALL